MFSSDTFALLARGGVAIMFLRARSLLFPLFIGVVARLPP